MSQETVVEHRGDVPLELARGASGSELVPPYPVPYLLLTR